MERGILKFSWEQWRDILGPSGTRQRLQIDEFRKTHPAILYWGDSWFSSPLGQNLARQSFAPINGLGMVVGKAGATASRLFAKDEVKRISARIKNNTFDIVVLSAGGNDTLSERLDRVFKRWTTERAPKINADEAYQVLLQAGLLQGIRDRYASLLDSLARVRRSHASLQVIGHTYAPIVRIGVKADLSLVNIGLISLIKGNVGPWLWKPMVRVLHSKDEGRRFADLMIHGFRDEVMQPLVDTAAYAEFFSYVDFTELPETEEEAFWHDEIHPTSAGFAVLAKRLNNHIREKLPAKKRAAVGN